MAKGRVNGDKVKVTEFSEKKYRVSVSGTSVAELSAGKTLTSNIATVRHEKYADITLSNPVTGDTSCCGYTYSITITGRNIVDGTLRVVTYPSWVSKFTITGDKLCYNLYQNYEVDPHDDIGVFVVAGEDEYGNLITSEPLKIRPGDKYDWGAIMWEESGITVSASETSGTATYNLSGCVVNTSIEICGYYGNIYDIELATGDTSGQISIYFPENRSRNFEKNYAVRLCGIDEFGVLITSDILVITQEKAAGVPSFYITGKDIDYLDTEGIFSVIYDQEEIIGETIGIYDWTTDTIMGTPVYDPETGKVTVRTLANTGNTDKVLSITMTASTVGNVIIYANGIISQRAGRELKIYDDFNIPKTEVTSSTRSAYFEQTRTFRYTSRNVGTVTATIEEGQGDGVGVSVDTVNKTVTVTFPRNEESQQKTFKIRLSSSTTPRITATYQFFQTEDVNAGFELTCGEHIQPVIGIENEGVLEYYETSFTLNIVCASGAGYSNFGVSLNSSDSEQYKIKSAVVDETGMTVACETYANSDQQSHIYQIQVSAMTLEGITAETDIFKITHMNEQGTGAISAQATTGETGYMSTSYTGITFTYTGITSVFIETITTSDGSSAEVTNIQFDSTAASGTGTYDLSFGQNSEPEERTISVIIGGLDIAGNRYVADTPFVLTQEAAVIPGIHPTVTEPLRSSHSGETVEYEVTYEGIDASTLSIIYDDGIFTNVTLSGATILVENEAVGGDDIVYVITFSAITEVSRELILAPLEILQPGATCETSALTISSDAAYYDEELDKYIINVNGGSYNINIDENVNVDTSSLVCVTSNPDIASGTSWMVTFGPASGNTSPWETGSTSEDLINIPVGNDSVRYIPSIVTIRKDAGQEETENLFVYYIDLDRYEVDEETDVWLTGTTYCGDPISSNVLTFSQTGTPTEPQEEP